jgi:hypothetical protein
VETPIFQALRAAFDRATHLYTRHVSPSVWSDLSEREVLTVDVEGGTLALEAIGRPKPSAPVLTWNGNGLYVQVRNPGVDTGQGRYPTKVEYQGLLCSTARNGLDAIESTRPAVEAILYPGLSDILADETVPGMFDLCVDIQVSGPDADAWIEQRIFSEGRVDVAAEAFSTRARPGRRKQQAHVSAKRDKDGFVVEFMGSRATGRTMAFGTEPRFMLYEKDKNTGAVSGRDLPIVKERWREGGWNDSDRVIRGEWRCERAWIANNAIASIDPNPEAPGEVVMKALPWDAFHTLAASIGVELAGRFRHTDVTEKRRRNRRASSPYQLAVHEAFGRWDAQHGQWLGVAMIKTIAREAAEKRATRRAQTGLVDLQVLRDRGESMEVIGAAIGRQLDAETRTESAIARDIQRRQARVALVHGIGGR